MSKPSVHWSLLLLLLLAVSEFSLAAPFELKHEVSDHYTEGSYQNVTLNLSLINLSEVNLHRVKLLPSNASMHFDMQTKQLNIGFLPAGGYAVVNWTLSTPIAVEYFQAGMPLFFVIVAKQENGIDIEIPLVSRGAPL